MSAGRSLRLFSQAPMASKHCVNRINSYAFSSRSRQHQRIRAAAATEQAPAAAKQSSSGPVSISHPLAFCCWWTSGCCQHSMAPLPGAQRPNNIACSHNFFFCHRIATCKRWNGMFLQLLCCRGGQLSCAIENGPFPARCSCEGCKVAANRHHMPQDAIGLRFVH